MQVDHAVLAVSDLPASLPWYEALLPLLGFTKTRAHVWVNAQAFGLDLQQAKDPTHAYAREGVGLNHFAVRASSRAEVDYVARAMKQAGFDVPTTQDFGDAYALFLKDRDGMRIEVTFESAQRE